MPLPVTWLVRAAAGVVVRLDVVDGQFLLTLCFIEVDLMPPYRLWWKLASSILTLLIELPPGPLMLNSMPSRP